MAKLTEQQKEDRAELRRKERMINYDPYEIDMDDPEYYESNSPKAEKELNFDDGGKRRGKR